MSVLFVYISKLLDLLNCLCYDAAAFLGVSLVLGFFLLVAVVDSYCRTTCPNVSLIIWISWLLILSILLLEKKHFQFLQFFQMALYCWRSFVSDKRDWWAKSWTHETPTKKNFGPTKHPSEKSSDPRSTREKKFRTHKTPMRKNLGPIKYPQVKLLEP